MSTTITTEASTCIEDSLYLCCIAIPRLSQLCIAGQRGVSSGPVTLTALSPGRDRSACLPLSLTAGARTRRFMGFLIHARRNPPSPPPFDSASTTRGINDSSASTSVMVLKHCLACQGGCREVYFHRWQRRWRRKRILRLWSQDEDPRTRSYPTSAPFPR